MSKYKKLLIILGGLVGAIVLCFILSFTLFGVRNVKLHFKNNTSIYASEEAEDNIIKSGKIPYAMPIFSVNKKEIIKNLEKENSYLKVVNIETVFPNNLIVHVAEREELFAIKIGDNLFYICDSELKVLSLTTSFNSTQSNAVLLEGVEVENKTAKVGEFLSLHNSESIIKNISNAFAFNNKTISDVKGMFKKISVSYKQNYYTLSSECVLTFTTFDDFNTEIDLPKENLIEKVNLMLAIVPKSIDKYGKYKLVIALNPENILDYYIRYEKLVWHVYPFILKGFIYY